MVKIDTLTPDITYTKIPIITGVVIIFLVTTDLLMTRQLLSFNNTMKDTMFILTVIIGYGIGSWLLLGYTTRVS